MMIYYHKVTEDNNELKVGLFRIRSSK